jgi:hypothetical protein
MSIETGDRQMTPAAQVTINEFPKLQGLGGNHGFLTVKGIVERTGCSRDEVIEIARRLGVDCEPHGRYGYCVWIKGA